MKSKKKEFCRFPWSAAPLINPCTSYPTDPSVIGRYRLIHKYYDENEIKDRACEYFSATKRLLTVQCNLLSLQRMLSVSWDTTPQRALLSPLEFLPNFFRIFSKQSVLQQSFARVLCSKVPSIGLSTVWGAGGHFLSNSSALSHCPTVSAALS